MEDSKLLFLLRLFSTVITIVDLPIFLFSQLDYLSNEIL
nr:MAG TPA: hypothetical protein [Bacteriophage sp.]